MSRSKIEWTDETWNPTTGCTKVSSGCKFCYAERFSKRLQAMKVQKYANGFEVKIHRDALELPLHWRRPRLVFVDSMSDLFHELIPEEFIQEVFHIMGQATQHRFQVLTKRSRRLQDLSSSLEWLPNVWMGVSVENGEYTYRIDHLRSTGAKVKFLSLEPLLGPIPSLELHGIDWVIVGGESGPGARPMEKEWVLEIRDKCIEANIPFFFKQWGGKSKKRTGRVLDGKTWDEMPVCKSQEGYRNLVGNLCHDLGISAWLIVEHYDSLLEEASDRLNDEQTTGIEIMHKKGQLLLSSIDEINQLTAEEQHLK